MRGICEGGVEEVECGEIINVLSLPKYVQYPQTKQVALAGTENIQAIYDRLPQFVSHIQHAINSHNLYPPSIHPSSLELNRPQSRLILTLRRIPRPQPHPISRLVGLIPLHLPLHRNTNPINPPIRGQMHMLTPHGLSVPCLLSHQNTVLEFAILIRTGIHSRVDSIEADIGSVDYDVVFAAVGVHGEAVAVGFGPVVFVGGFVAPVLVAFAAGFVEGPVDHGLGGDGGGGGEEGEEVALELHFVV